jgi:DNA-binding response OmpR family regulator
VRLADRPTTQLTDLEVQLLRYLAANRGRAISRDELLARVWRLDPTGLDTRTVDMAVMRLREKLGDDGAAPAVLLTVRGKGYMLAAEVSQ